MPQADDTMQAAEKERAAVLDAVWSQLEGGDSFQACALVESRGEPVLAALLYSNLVRDLYGQKRDVPRMILLGLAGIRFCLEQARAVEPGDGAKANELTGIAKTMSYNLSVNTWPAWEDEGIVVTRSDQLIGLDAARLNLRLARELNRAADKIGAACWLLGAHYLALGEQERAVEHFESAAELHREAGQPDFELMCAGYVAIARLEKDRGDAAAQRQFDEAVAALSQLDTGDAKFFADQLAAVNRYFAAGS